MSLKSRATVVENTGGQLKYQKNLEPIVGPNGLDIDFTEFEFEDNREGISHIEIFNLGPDKCVIGYDTQKSLVDCLDRSTFNHPIFPGKPFNYISIDGEANSMSMKTLPGKSTTLLIIIW